MSRLHRKPSSRNRPAATIALLGALFCVPREAAAQAEPAPTAPVEAPPPLAPPEVTPPELAPPELVAPQFAPPPPLAPPEVGKPTATRRVRLRYDLALDLTAVGVMTAGLVTWAVVKGNVDPPSCVICDGAPGRVNAVDDFFRTTFKHSNGSAAGTTSDVLAYGVAPVTGIVMAVAVSAHDGRIDEAAVDSLLVVEATLAFAVLQQGLTAIIPRERPAAHFTSGDDRTQTLQRHSSLESFPAGHNGSAFAIAAAGGTVATMRGYRLAPLVWIVGGAIALATSYLRIAADRHYFTDVTTGAALGIGTGIAIPLLLHPRLKDEAPNAATRWLRGATVSTTEIPGGRMASIGWGF